MITYGVNRSTIYADPIPSYTTTTSRLLPTVSSPIETIHNPFLIPLGPSRLALLLPMCYNLPSRTPLNGTKPRSCHRISSLTTTTSHTSILRTPFPSLLACIPLLICINDGAHNASFPQDWCTRTLLVGFFQHHNFFKATCAIISLTSRRLKEERWICCVNFSVCM